MPLYTRMYYRWKLHRRDVDQAQKVDDVGGAGATLGIDGDVDPAAGPCGDEEEEEEEEEEEGDIAATAASLWLADGTAPTVAGAGGGGDGGGSGTAAPASLAPVPVHAGLVPLPGGGAASPDADVFVAPSAELMEAPLDEGALVSLLEQSVQAELSQNLSRCEVSATLAGFLDRLRFANTRSQGMTEAVYRDYARCE
jgi:hypothetical protein